MNQLRPLRAADERAVEWVVTEGVRLAEHARPAWGIKRLFLSRANRRAAEEAVTALVKGVDGARSSGVESALKALRSVPDVRRVSPEQALDPSVGLAEVLQCRPSELRLYQRKDFKTHIEAAKALEKALAGVEALRKAAVEAGNALRIAEVHRLLDEMPVERLREATAGRLNLGALEQAGLTTVQSVLDARRFLEQIPGIGPTSAVRSVGAAQNIWHTTLEDMPCRIDVKRRTEEASSFLRAVAAWDTARRSAGDDGQAHGRDVRAMLAMLGDELGEPSSCAPAARQQEPFPQLLIRFESVQRRSSVVPRGRTRTCGRTSWLVRPTTSR
ncbi:hypothetical protein [Tessaracoccus palaemonis]|uniref:DUF4332 domain-containing protein n=1 Tax=Tessaracoccus palaemonis TaxID=2829499 RepID=A0ABX8SJN6_9ACTN|nr:hypothetical protein [Tessaracoccus palaemonis]QXT62657.1 hypothetical protein KDB89_13110 [Tessaracoccus palaemonis]